MRVVVRRHNSEVTTDHFFRACHLLESAADLWVPSEINEASKRTSDSVLLNMVRDIEPLDISTISKEASPDSTGAMKRTISGMLGLLPSDQFQVTIETSPDHLARLLVSSMMTGYTLRNAEYRLSLQRTLELASEDVVNQQRKPERESRNSNSTQLRSGHHCREAEGVPKETESELRSLPKDIVGVSAKVASYIQQLQEKLSATSKELEACKTNMKREVSSSATKLDSGLATTNDLLDYLRSLEPEKVAELSQPSKEVQDAVEQVVAGLLGTLVSNPKPSIPPFRANQLSSPWEGCTPSEVVGNVPLQSHSTVASPRDYLARLLFWCTLVGYYMRGLEYRLELSRTLRLIAPFDHSILLFGNHLQNFEATLRRFTVCSQQTQVSASSKTGYVQTSSRRYPVWWTDNLIN
ncbi:hypothetical protein R1flu_027592 [Riccia fluitans]|uniref:Uncharacterized protein n=1 Tax=Riccia fluitans TaxID=41844 RepID=A0ABD1XJA2_9MARC